VRLRSSHQHLFDWLVVPLILAILIGLVFGVRWLRYQQSCTEAAPKHWGEMSYGHCFKDQFEELQRSK
jgi:hypothetical protein